MYVCNARDQAHGWWHQHKRPVWLLHYTSGCTCIPCDWSV